jgi:hypothetical protein
MLPNQNLQVSEEESERRQVEHAVNTMLTIVSDSYEKMTAYTNLLMVAGYAGFFALWQMSKDFLTKTETLSAALLTLISLAIFVFFEIYRALEQMRLLRRYSNAFMDDKITMSAASLQATMDDYKAKAKGTSSRLSTTWLVVFVLTTLFGLAGTAVLLIALIRALLR